MKIAEYIELVKQAEQGTITPLTDEQKLYLDPSKWTVSNPPTQAPSVEPKPVATTEGRSTPELPKMVNTAPNNPFVGYYGYKPTWNFRYQIKESPKPPRTINPATGLIYPFNVKNPRPNWDYIKLNIGNLGRAGYKAVAKDPVNLAPGLGEALFGIHSAITSDSNKQHIYNKMEENPPGKVRTELSRHKAQQELDKYRRDGNYIFNSDGVITDPHVAELYEQAYGPAIDSDDSLEKTRAVIEYCAKHYYPDFIKREFKSLAQNKGNAIKATASYSNPWAPVQFAESLINAYAGKKIFPGFYEVDYEGGRELTPEELKPNPRYLDENHVASNYYKYHIPNNTAEAVGAYLDPFFAHTGFKDKILRNWNYMMTGRPLKYLDSAHTRVDYPDLFGPWLGSKSQNEINGRRPGIDYDNLENNPILDEIIYQARIKGYDEDEIQNMLIDYLDTNTTDTNALKYIAYASPEYLYKLLRGPRVTELYDQLANTPAKVKQLKITPFQIAMNGPMAGPGTLYGLSKEPDIYEYVDNPEYERLGMQIARELQDQELIKRLYPLMAPDKQPSPEELDFLTNVDNYFLAPETELQEPREGAVGNPVMWKLRQIAKLPYQERYAQMVRLYEENPDLVEYFIQSNYPGEENKDIQEKIVDFVSGRLLNRSMLE